GVQFKLDGAVLGAEDTSAPYSAGWDTTKSTNAQHTLTAVARDAAGNTSSSSVTVSVSNAAAQSPAPPPSGSKLAWAPPALSSPITVTVPSGGGIIKMDTARDYIVKVGHLSACGGLWLEGGHNVVVIGGEISIVSTCGSAYDRTAVKVRANT